jgi:hypothetical protein
LNGRVALLGLALLATNRCAAEQEQPPPVTCRGDCFIPRPHVVGHVPPSSGDAGAGGESGGGEGPVRLGGDVWILNDLPRLTATRFQEPADLVVDGESGDVTGRYTGFDPFSLDGVKRSTATWVLATPGPGDALPSLQAVDTSKPTDAGGVTVELTVARESELERAFSVISQPIAPNSMAAQVVLAVQKGERAAAGVRVTALDAEAVIYVEGSSFSDTVTETDSSGIVVLANVPASGWPGSGVTVTLAGEVTGRWDLRVVRGAVTIAGIGE